MAVRFRAVLIGLVLKAPRVVAGIMTLEEMAMKKAHFPTLKCKITETHLSLGWDF